jgi:hypothetical protein
MSEEDIDTGSPPPSSTVNDSSDRATEEMTSVCDDASEFEWIATEDVQSHRDEDYSKQRGTRAQVEYENEVQGGKSGRKKANVRRPRV